MSLNITNNNNPAQETFLKQLEGLALARDILTTKKLNKNTKCDTTVSNSTCGSSMSKKVILPKEAMQLLSNLEALKEAGTRYLQRNSGKALPSNITETPSFHEAKVEPVELSDSAKETFTRIGARARKAFIKEQMARADKYNIPYNCFNVDFLELSYKIDQYEFLLAEAKDLGIFWDITDYDPIALEQEIEEAKHNSCAERMNLHFYFNATRGVEV